MPSWRFAVSRIPEDFAASFFSPAGRRLMSVRSISLPRLVGGKISGFMVLHFFGIAVWHSKWCLAGRSELVAGVRACVRWAGVLPFFMIQRGVSVSVSVA